MEHSPTAGAGLWAGGWEGGGSVRWGMGEVVVERSKVGVGGVDP